jgi:tetratricopeptide (TPR) repeat protein
MKKFDEANEHLKKKEFEQAKALLEDLLQTEPDHGVALYNLGMIYNNGATENKSS